MQKIALLIDPKGVDNIALKYAVYISQLTNSRLTGIFINANPATSLSIPKHHSSFANKNSSTPIQISEVTPYKSIQENKKLFTNYYLNNGFSISPETVEITTKEELIQESRFLDLMVISAEASFADSIDSTPSALTEHLLRHAECPILIAPISYNEIDEIVFTYDGSESSVFAIKEFTHLFVQLEDKKVTFLEVNRNESHDIVKQEKITDYLKMHYSNIGYQVLHGEPKNELFGYFIGKKNALIVLGSFGRNILSSLFNRSTAQLLLKTTTLPIFITHK